MRPHFVLCSFLLAALPLSASAQVSQGFYRNTCCDPSTLEVRSQLSLSLPVDSKASTADTMKSIEDARRDLYAMANRECDTLKGIFGGDCTLSSININSSTQNRFGGNESAMVSINNTYQIKRTPK